MDPSLEPADWLGALRRWVPERVIAWRGEEAVRAGLRGWLATQLSRVEDSAFGAEFAAGCPWPGAVPADYQQRLVPFPGGSALAGIRFRACRSDFRFVDLLAHTGPDDAETLGRAATAVLEAHACFAPQALRVRQARARELTPSGWQAVDDQLFLAGRLGALAEQARPAGVELVDAASAEEAADYVGELYAAWTARDPQLAERVLPATAPGLEACRVGGVLAYIHTEGARAGLIAVAPGSDAELGGFFVEEEVVALPFRGRGLAARAQGLASVRLAARDPAALLFGTIDAANAASLKTARRAGREVVSAYRYLR